MIQTSLYSCTKFEIESLCFEACQQDAWSGLLLCWHCGHWQVVVRLKSNGSSSVSDED